MSARVEAPDTPRRHIEALARRAAAYPNLSDDVEDEVAMASALPRNGALRAFADLVLAYRRRERDKAETVLDLLTGRLR